MGFRNSLPLVKFIKTAKISFNPFDGSSGALRILMASLKSEKTKKINDILKVDLDVGLHVNNPALDITYSKFTLYDDFLGDGKTLNIPAKHLALDELEKQVFKHTLAIRNKEEGL